MISFVKRHRLLLIGAGTALFAAFLYWPVLSLPLIFDDILHIRLAKDLDFVKVWLPSTDFGFYRPLVFLPFLIIKPLFGHYPPAMLHGFNLIQQSINVLLISWLAWRLWHSWRRTLTVGALLACYPFAYQAIAFYGNISYPLSAGFILLALHTYLWAIQPQAHRKWWIVTVTLFAVGLLIHETVVLFGPLAALLHWVYQEEGTGNGSDRRLDLFKFRNPISRAWIGTVWRKAPYLCFVLLGGLYALVYQLLLVGTGPQFDPGSIEPLPKLLYVLQSASYPFAWFAHRLPGLSANAIVFGGFGLTVILTFWAARRAENRRSLLMGWVWWGLASLLIGLTLPTFYILHGARLLYLGGVGVVIVWTVLIGDLFELPKIGGWLWAVAMGFLMITSGVFVRGRLAAFTEIASPISLVEEAMAGRPVDEGVLLVNLPQWTSPARNTYAVGVEYVTLMGRHLFAEELIVENLGGHRPVLAIEQPGLLVDSGYPYGVHNQADLDVIRSDWAPGGSNVFISSYLETGINTEHTGRFAMNSQSRPLAVIEPYILLDALANLCENAVQVTLAWDRSLTGDSLDSAALTETTSSFVQLLDDGGQLISQLDGPPLGLRPDLIQLQPGWQMEDRRTVPLLGEGVPSQVVVGIYDFVTGERAPALDSENLPLPDNAFRIPVTESCAVPGSADQIK